jgi:hypothetical protein
MDTRKTTKTAPIRNAAVPAACQRDAGGASRKLVRERLAPEMDRCLLRLGLPGLLDGGAPK